jgi:AcrR family transcriptional regulator
MGLREKKALLTRQRIVAEAMTLFASQGYAETTMESIAEAAMLHPSTVYRYFPSKDLIVLADFTSSTERFTIALNDALETMPLEDALTVAIDAVLDDDVNAQLEQRVVRSIIDQSPAARARLWDYLDEQRTLTGTIIARHLGKEPADFEVVMCARVAILIVETAADIWRYSDSHVSARQIARDLAVKLRAGRIILPNDRA